MEQGENETDVRHSGTPGNPTDRSASSESFNSCELPSLSSPPLSQPWQQPLPLTCKAGSHAKSRPAVKMPKVDIRNKWRRRVKIFALNEQQLWSYFDTGYVYSSYVERLQGLSLQVQSQSDSSLILESKIHPETPYQRKKGVLIVWSEAENHGMALSFQNKAVCQEIWEDICRVQGIEPSVNSTRDLLDIAEEEECDNMAENDHLVNLPNCELNNLEEIAYLVARAFDSSAGKESLVLILDKEDYIQKLLQLLHTCETLGDIEGLHQLHGIIKRILFLNKPCLYETMFSDECIMNVVGCLEYDPALTQPKRHREFLTKHAKFKEVVPITNCELRQKIHQMYRVQYILNILLPVPSIFEKYCLSSLRNCISFYKVEIVYMLQTDNEFLPQVLAQLKDKTTDDDTWREFMLFFKELCSFSQVLQPQSKNELLKTLIKLGILPALKIAMSLDDLQIRSVATDILVCLVEYSPSAIRTFIRNETQWNEDCNLFINLIIKQMICDTVQELGNALHLKGLLYSLLDPDNMLAAHNNYEKCVFLHFFYNHCMHNLIEPLLSITSEDTCKKDDILGTHENSKNCLNNYQTAQLLSLIVELLTFCVQHHTYYIKNYILNRDLLKRVLILMNSKHTFLILCALRFMRSIIGIKDELYNHYIIRENLLQPVVNALLGNGARYNMLNSAILELFEYIRVENIKSLVTHIVEKFYEKLECIEYVQIFKGLKMNYEQEKDQENEIKKFNTVVCNKILHIRSRVLEKEKICYKENIEEEEAVMQPLVTGFQVDSMETEKSKEKKNKPGLPKITTSGSCEFTFSHSVETGSSTGSNLVGLVNYPDDNEEEKEGETPPRKRLHHSP